MRFSSSTAAKRVVDVFLDCLIVLLAFMGIVLALAGSPWAPLWVLPRFSERRPSWSRPRSSGPGRSPFGRSLVLRGTAAAATAVCLGALAPGRPRALGAALGAAILVGSIVVEPFVGRAARFKVPVAIRLPNRADPTRDARSRPGRVGVSTVATAVGLLFALGASPWWWAFISLLACRTSRGAGRGGPGEGPARPAASGLVPRAVAAYAPDFVVYTSRPDDASYQVTDVAAVPASGPGCGFSSSRGTRRRPRRSPS